MQIQLNTDNNVAGPEGFAVQVEGDVRAALERFAEHITRIEVHLSDSNSDKDGGRDKRCMMEARLAGRQPMSVSHEASTVALAIDGASDKLARALDRVLGKLQAGRRGNVGNDVT